MQSATCFLEVTIRFIAAIAHSNAAVRCSQNQLILFCNYTCIQSACFYFLVKIISCVLFIVISSTLQRAPDEVTTRKSHKPLDSMSQL